MKILYTLLIVLWTSTTFSQNFDRELTSISEAEAKAAMRRMSQNYSRNMNTGNYDIKYHRLEFDIDPSQASISGQVTTYFEAKENLSQVTFELTDNMIVSEVLQRGSSLSFSQNADDEVVITLPQTQNLGVLDSLTISYSGNPISSGFGSFAQTTHSGDPIIWTLSEPYGAKGWWPCKQDLIDKIDSIDVYLTTPTLNPSNEEYIAVSNGVELSQIIDGDSKTTRYKHRYPIPAYLVAIAVTNYEVYSHTVPNNGNPFEIVNYVYPENLASAQASTPVTVDIMNLFSNLFEEYPYANEKYGHAQFGWGGGMEHTTVSFMGGFSRGLIAHELAHQWFGNKITCGSWKDIWLNEGFATYLSGLVIEDFDGNGAFRNWKEQRISSITSSPSGAVYLSDADTTSVNRIFSSRLSYNKGAMVLHMLRKKIGDAQFYQGMQDYLATPELAFAYAKTPDYQTKMEAASGEDLTEFFNDWVYNQGYPSYTIDVSPASGNQVLIQINQTQSDASVDFFEAPVPIRLVGTGGENLDLVLNNSFDGETFLETVNFEVSNVLFDPEFDIISKNNNITLSISDYELDQALIIYPNPTESYITIQKPEKVTISNVEVYNTLGQKVLSLDSPSIIMVDTLSDGLYFLKLYTNKGVIVKRVVKE
ncbi:peptidase M1 [Hanstruepera neustonica]|uniref:Aminopeptidase N n=1 Tax=Hanstruepera neustonica TaxID=1445657 RepID=A0A2K1E313_9FLAO|nr:M1 family aminopeptidase [Hanstruepera neustonica]PNQ74684.1 peptidase M1 [Hanstruepera neustonica]